MLLLANDADGMSRVPCKQCQHCGTSEDTDSKHTIHTAVSQKSDITHSGDMSLVNAQQSDPNIQKMKQWTRLIPSALECLRPALYCISISKEQRIWSHRDITHSGDVSLVNAQQSDRNIQKMRQWVEKGTKPSYDSIRGENYVMQSLYSQWNKLVIHESLLCREWKVIGTTMSSFQAIVPLTQRQLCHSSD
jgi:hypothetical protein